MKFLLASTTLLLLTTNAIAGNNIWDDLFKRLNKSNGLELQASIEQQPTYKLTPKLLSFRGVVEVPSQLILSSGAGKIGSTAAQLVFDNSIVCNYSPKSNILFNNIYSLVSCSDGSRAKDDIQVLSKIELKLNLAASTKATITAKIKVLQRDEVEYGVILPYLQAQEGQVLTFNGEAWVAAFPEENAEGTQGPQGPQGPQGEQGPQGVAGPQGPKGDKGDAGPAGAPGVAGPSGAMGPQGPAGSAGATGAMGPQGPQGLKGDKGDTGAAGPAGASGSVGATGAMGPQGPQGLKGDKGDTGATGPAGAAGAVGAVGPQGPQGLKGDKGDTGATGPAGAAGAAGAVGPQGPQGPQGPAGADGAPGVAGAQGPQGVKGDTGATGPAGSTGPMGPMGPMGMTGAVGATGPQGPQGAPGADGAPGAQGPQGLKGDKGDRGLSEIAYLRDERATGVMGGPCTAGSWQQRTLNVLGGDTNFISLSSNRFVLQPGKYFIDVTAPGYAVNSHQAKLIQVETASDVILGSTAFSGTAAMTSSYISGEIVVTTSSTFEIQHRCSTTRTVSGFGAAANFGNNEIFTQVKIIRKQ